VGGQHIGELPGQPEPVSGGGPGLRWHVAGVRWRGPASGVVDLDDEGLSSAPAAYAHRGGAVPESVRDQFADGDRHVVGGGPGERLTERPVARRTGTRLMCPVVGAYAGTRLA
jgi:hypothetical protein